METFKIEGLVELKEALDEMSKATSRNVIKRALTQAAEPLERDAERMAPVFTGKLQKSINISTKLSKRQRAQNKPESKFELFVGAKSSAASIVQEFGSSKQAPQPFMRPAWDHNKKGMLLSIKSILTEEIEKARQRAARKAAKILAKMKGTTNG